MWVPEYSGTYAWSGPFNYPVKRVATSTSTWSARNVLKTNSWLNLNKPPIPILLPHAVESVSISSTGSTMNVPRRRWLFISVPVTGFPEPPGLPMVPLYHGNRSRDLQQLENRSLDAGRLAGHYYHSSEDIPDKVDPPSSTGPCRRAGGHDHNRLCGRRNTAGPGSAFPGLWKTTDRRKPFFAMKSLLRRRENSLKRAAAGIC